MRAGVLICAVVLAGWLGAAPALAQVVYGSISGSVADQSGSVIPRASVRLTHDETGAVREAATGERGGFAFAGLPIGTYTLDLVHTDFRKYQRKQIMLSPNDRLALGEIRLELGAITETVSVTSEGAAVQTASSERSGVITSEQVENLMVINRDFSDLVGLLPGVVTEPGGETQGFGSNSTFYVQGGRNTGNNITIDGLPAADLGNSTANTAYVSMDSVATVRIMVSNYAAEFGRKPGAGIQAVTKSGTRQFHGTMYYFKRHEGFNANDFFNNRNGITAARYRNTTLGFNVGGPVYIPGVFNTGRQKLFFFFSTEHIREARPQPIRQVTMPTQLEGLGNFSDSRDLNSSLIVVRDPANNATPYPDNIIPKAQINPVTQKYLNLLPLPNFFDVGISARRYNYQVQDSFDVPKHMETGRLDYQIDAKSNVYGRFNNWWEDRRGLSGRQQRQLGMVARSVSEHVENRCYLEHAHSKPVDAARSLDGRRTSH